MWDGRDLRKDGFLSVLDRFVRSSDRFRAKVGSSGIFSENER